MKPTVENTTNPGFSKALVTHRQTLSFAMPPPFGAIGQKCQAVLSTPSQVTAQLQHSGEDQHSFILGSSYVWEPKEDEDEASSQFGYTWSDELAAWRYALAIGGGVVTNKVDYTFDKGVRGDVSVSHEDGVLVGSKVHLMVNRDGICARVLYDLLKQKPIVEMVVGDRGWSGGVQLVRDWHECTPSYVLGYSMQGYDFGLTAANNFKNWAIKGYATPVKNWEFGSRASFNGKAKKLELGVKYSLDKDTKVKAKIEQTLSRIKPKAYAPKIGISLTQEVSRGLKITLGSLFDLKTIHTPKIGCVLSFSS